MEGYRSSILSILDQDLIFVDGVGYWIFYLSGKHRRVVPDIFHSVVLGWFVVRVRDERRDRFFLLFFFLLFKGSLPIFRKWRMKWSKLLRIFFFFN
jgi:hypothetical protein